MDIIKRFVKTAVLILCINGVLCTEGLTQTNDFTVKAFHLDLRIQVMTMPALKAFAQKIHDQGINTLIMEYEASYPYQKHPLIPNRYAYTKEEIVSFIAFCNKLGVDVIPLQQSFGHVEYILRNYKYASLREDDKDFSQVCPLETEKDSLLFTDLYTELIATHTSKYIHIGADETHLLGHCPKCSKKVAEEGVSKLYIDYIRMLCNIVIRLGKRPVLWADIALKYPEALQSLPKETVFVDWNYGWDVNHFGKQQKLLESGFEIWGAPAIRSYPDDYFLEQWDKHFNNIKTFVPMCRQMGYKGIVMTSWSTSGAYSYLYESEDEFTELYAQRHVYPVTGFNIIIAAYAKSISSATPLNIEEFVRQYCKDQYGLDKDDALSFWEALDTGPFQVEKGEVNSTAPMSLDKLINGADIAAGIFKRLQPLKNKEEFGHYRLMADIRLQYLHYLSIEKQLNTGTGTTQDISTAIKQLQALLVNADSLDQRFINLNKASYNLAELKNENDIRDKKIHLLYDRLTRKRI